MSETIAPSKGKLEIQYHAPDGTISHVSWHIDQPKLKILDHPVEFSQFMQNFINEAESASAWIEDNTPDITVAIRNLIAHVLYKARAQ
jgi:hypothetical protein